MPGNKKKNPAALSNAVVLLSGGIDSAACVVLLKKKGLRPSGLFVDFGQPAGRSESRAVSALSRSLGINCSRVNIGPNKKFGAGEIVGRNAFLVLSALMFARPKSGPIVLGIHAGTPYFDCSETFNKLMADIVAEHTDGQNQFLAPFLQWSKAEVVAFAKREHLPIRLTYSCETGSKPCGRCLSCRDRLSLGVR